MYDETNERRPEFRVRPVVRYLITRYCHPSADGLNAGGSEVIGEFANEERAHDVLRALAEADRDATVST